MTGAAAAPRRWTTAEVARASGASARALRHYDAIGLVTPAATGPGGVRLYEQAQLLRLQQVLLLRDLGLPLAEVAAVLDRSADPVAALRGHLARLQAEADRLGRLAQSVRTTIRRLEAGGEMDPDTMYDGVDPAQQAAWEAEVVDRYGAEALAASRRPDRGEAARLDADLAAVERAVADLMSRGAAPHDLAVLDALDTHHAVVSRCWTPDAQAYTGLGELYAESPDFRARYEARAAGLADFLRDALAAYARARL